MKAHTSILRIVAIFIPFLAFDIQGKRPKKKKVEPVQQYKQLNKNKHNIDFYLKRDFSRPSNSKKIEPFPWPAQVPAIEKTAELLKNLYSGSEYDNVIFGASTSEHQCSKQCTPDICTYSNFAHERNLLQPTDSQYPVDMWNHYKTYINAARDHLHINSLRFSVEMALVYQEQSNGHVTINQETINHYTDMFLYCIKRGITPIICFHHYTDPVWFARIGGFEKKYNITFFVEFCTKTYQALITALDNDPQALAALHKMSPRRPLFATFNSPEGYVFKGYREMTCPPADETKKGLTWTTKVMYHVLRAHTQVYHALHNTYKELELNHKDLIGEPQVGILKNIHQLDPANNTPKQKMAKILSKFVCSIGNMLQNDCIFDYFTTGHYRVHVPFKVNYHKYDADAVVGVLDWIGINYYSNGIMHLGTKLKEQDPQYMTDNRNYRLYPMGLYRAIVEMTERLSIPLGGIPLYVTENGIATEDHAKRNRFYQDYLYAFYRARRDGYPVFGYLTWSLMDNYEWPHPNAQIYEKRSYGLLEFPDNNPAHVSVKPGAQNYQQFVKTFFS